MSCIVNKEESFVRPPSLRHYINEITPLEDENSSIAREALAFLKIYVGVSVEQEQDEGEDEDDFTPNSSGLDGTNVPAEGVLVPNEISAKTIVNGMSTCLKRAVLALLTEHVHVPFRKQTTAVSKELVSWLQLPNSIRNYWFYKVVGLTALINARGLTQLVGGGRKKAEDLRNLLAGNDRGDAVPVPPVPPPRSDPNNFGLSSQTVEQQSYQDAATKAILEKSFLPHQKGKAREHCSMGHRLEIPILDSWIKVATDRQSSPVPGLCVKGAYSAGLAAKKNATHAKDSVDFVITVTESNFSIREEAGEEDDTIEDVVKVWGFEAKGRVTARTAAAEERNLHFYNRPHVRIDDVDAHEEVANEGERFQVLQHAFVYDFDTVVLAISDSQSYLIRSTVIDYSTELKNHFGKVLNDLKDISLAWAYPETDNQAAATNRAPKVLIIPARILSIADTIKTINGSHTLQGTANIWFSLVH